MNINSLILKGTYKFIVTVYIISELLLLIKKDILVVRDAVCSFNRCLSLTAVFIQL